MEPPATQTPVQLDAHHRWKRIRQGLRNITIQSYTQSAYTLTCRVKVIFSLPNQKTRILFRQ